MAQRSLQWYRDSEAKEIAFLKEKGATIITEKEGLKVGEFRDSVLKQVNADYPNWKSYLDQLAAIK